MIYCEITSENKKFYGINDVPEETLRKLAGLLEQLNSKEFVALFSAISKELKFINGYPKFFNEADSKIEQCETCKGSGYLLDQHMLDVNQNKTVICHDCNGETGRVKKTFIQYEILNENIKKRFAR